MFHYHRDAGLNKYSTSFVEFHLKFNQSQFFNTTEFKLQKKLGYSRIKYQDRSNPLGGFKIMPARRSHIRIIWAANQFQLE